jgi:glycine cleavage system H protein
MSQIPANLKYLKSHEWVRLDADNTVTIGITDYAQSLLGDLVYVELPETGRDLAAGEECAVVESVKSASDVYSPVSGEIVAVNEALADAPEKINQSPYEDGWLFKIKLADDDKGMAALLDAEAYAAVIAAETE